MVNEIKRAQTMGRPTRQHPHSPLRVLLLMAAVSVVLLRCVPDWSSLRTHLAAPEQWVSQDGGDQAAATLTMAVLWLCACWLAVGLAFAFIGLFPGGAGRTAAGLAQRIMPALLERTILTAAGTSLLFSPAVAMADSLPAPSAAPPSIVLVVPTSDGSPVAAAPVPAAPVPAAPVPAAPVPAAPVPAAAASAPTVAVPAGAPTVAAPAAQRDEVTVGVGDSLWSLTAQQMGPHPSAVEVAAAWPRLYAANRAVIGADPNLVVPGQILVVPATGVTR